MFVRLQNGTTLKAAEKRNALPGKMKEFVRFLAQHDFFERCGFKNKRRDFDQVAAQCVLLEFHGGARNVKNSDLEKMYIENVNFDSTSDVAQRVQRTLNFLSKVFSERTPQIKQHNAISMYLLTSMLLKKYSVHGYSERIGKWFIEFEMKRLEDIDLPEDQRDPEMVAYQNAVGHSSDSIDSLEYRGKILSREFFSYFSDIVPLDPAREFSDEQRMAIYFRDQGVCQLRIKCAGKKLGWDDNWHADHRVPYSKGGKTIVENGRVSCAECNLARSND